MAATPKDVVGFWTAAGPQKWFAKSTKFDEAIALRFEPVHHAAARGEYDGWMASAEGSLALLLLLDQFPRNCFRSSGHAYATDPLARHYAARAVEAGFDAQVEPALRVFVYLPFEHSEDMADQQRSVELARGLPEGYLKYAIAHLDVIARFGRFPHRNRELGRVNTSEEQAWLDAGGGF